MTQLTGKNAAIWRLYETHSRALFAYAYSITHNAELAEDGVHDAILSVARGKSTPHSPKAYVFRAVRNESIRLARRNGRDASLESFDSAALFTAPPEGAPDAQSVRSEEAELLIQSLNSISQDEREVIILHIYAGMKFREIAETTQQPLPTVTSRYRRGLAKLGEILQEVHDETR